MEIREKYITVEEHKAEIEKVREDFAEAYRIMNDSYHRKFDETNKGVWTVFWITLSFSFVLAAAAVILSFQVGG